MSGDVPRTITGVFRTPEGVIVANRTLTWYRAPRKTAAQGASVILDELFRTSTDAAGKINVSVVPGNYLVMVRLADADRYFEVGVPEGTGDLDIFELVDTAAPPITPVEVTQAREYRNQAREARDKAREWATKPEDSPVGSDPDEFSARHWAAKAEAAADTAAASANAVFVFDAITDVQGANIPQPVTAIRTNGYHAPGDGGAALYKRVGSEPAHLGKVQSGDGAWWELAEDAPSIKMLGAKGDGFSDDTTSIQAAIDFVEAMDGGKLLLPAGLFMASSIQWKTGVYGEGAGYDVTCLKQIAGSNSDFIWSDGDIEHFGISNLEVDGTYFLSAWNESPGVLGNTSGGGIIVKTHSAVIDVLLNNVAGIGLHLQQPDSSRPSSVSDYLTTVSVVGRDFGKEGIIIDGPNDWHLKRAWIGRAGILPLPDAETQIAMSDVFSGDPVDGIVINGANIEIGDVHVYANWSGTGFRTRGNVRLTKGGRIISESNRSQVRIDQGAYGSAFFDVRRLALIHPHWTEPIPVYSGPDPEWDAVTIDADYLSAEVTVHRIITTAKRVVGSAGVVINGGSKVDVFYRNSAPSDDADPDYGTTYSGDAVVVAGTAGQISARVINCNGNSVNVTGDGNDITFSASGGRGGAALRRDTGAGNAMRGNNIKGTIVNCTTGFNSIGATASETINLTMRLRTTDVPFTGDKFQFARGQIWDISAAVGNEARSTRRFLNAPLDASSTDGQTVSISHGYLFGAPDYREVQLSIDDRATPSTAYLDYLVVNEITETDVVIGYKFATADTTPAANIRVNVRIG